MKWIALNGTYHGDYYLLKDKLISVTLQPEAKVFTGSLRCLQCRQFVIEAGEHRGAP